MILSTGGGCLPPPPFLSTGGKGVCLPPREQTPPPGAHPPGAHPPDQTHPPGSRHPPSPGSRPPRADTPPEADTPSSRHPPEQTPPRSRHPPEQTPPRSRHPRPDTSPGIRSMSGRYASYWNAFMLTVLSMLLRRRNGLVSVWVFVVTELVKCLRDPVNIWLNQ